MKLSCFIYISLSFILLSCGKDPVIPNEEELITTLTYTLTPLGGGQAVIFSFDDPDGDGGIAPVIQGDTLITGINYIGRITLLNKSTNPVTDITKEVDNEREDHQLFYTINGLHASVEYTDEDAMGFPVGLNTIFLVSSPGTGTLVITLRHQPDKAASGVSDGIILNAGGETDIEVTFPVVIQ